jgi:hypothetical protein
MKNAAVLFLFCSTFFGLWGCNESLPLYTPPENVLSAEIIPLNPPTDTVRYTMLDNNNPNLIRVTLNSPFHGYEIAIVNNYEETIQDYMEIEGNIVLAWSDKPELRTIISMTNTSFYDGDYDPVTGLLTINPGDTVRLRVYWNFKLSTDDWAFSQLRSDDSPAYFNGPLSSAMDRIHVTMGLQAEVRVKLYRSLSFVDTRSKNDIPVIFKGKILSPP